jgi:hypothetical protein
VRERVDVASTYQNLASLASIKVPSSSNFRDYMTAHSIIAKMDVDEEEPPLLVVAEVDRIDPIKDTEPVKVPITIVTGEIKRVILGCEVP